MADLVVAFEPTKPGSLGHGGRVWKWTAVTVGAICGPVAVQGAKDVTIFGEGAWTGGTTLALNASPQIDKDPRDDGTVYVPCKDLADTLIAIAADGHSTVAQLGEYYQPVTATGTGVIDIYLLARY